MDLKSTLPSLFNTPFPRCTNNSVMSLLPESSLSVTETRPSKHVVDSGTRLDFLKRPISSSATLLTSVDI